MSVRNIAKHAGVSISTVSRVLNHHPAVADDVRKKVLDAANQTRYTPAVGRRSADSIAFAYTGESSLGSPFDMALLQGISGRLDMAGQGLIILNASRARQPAETFTQMFMRKGIRGALLRTSDATKNVSAQIAAEGFPAVVIAERFANTKVNVLYSDSRQSSREAIEHLLDLGHRRIAIVVNVVDDTDHADRLAGYHGALADRGIEVDPRLILRIPANRGGGMQVLKRILLIPDAPTALFITDPLTAVGAINEARKLGIDVPRRLSIVGFDDSETRFSLFPELTAVCQDATNLGRQAIAMLQEILNKPGKSTGFQKALPTWFEILGSTGPALI